MIISAQAAPIHGFIRELAATLARMAVRKVLSSASTTVNGLSKIRMFMVLAARKTMKKAAMAIGIIRALYSQERSIVANPRELSDAPSERCAWNVETASGTNAPVATRPLILFSMASSTSKGFFSTAGTAMPTVSLTKHKPTSSSAGTKNQGLEYHESRALASGVLAA